MQLVSLKVSDATMNSSTTRLFRAINFAQRYGIRILNISMAFENNDSQLSAAISNFGGLIIAAAGNYGENIDVDKIYPAAFPHDNIISVGAIDQNDQRSIWDDGQSSNYGIQSVDIYAPGTDIISTDNQGGYYEDSGTSFAAPFVTGVAALFKSFDPNLSVSEIKDLILNGADTITISTPDGNQTVKKLNAGRAFNAIGLGGMFAGGIGTVDNPFLVSNETQFRNIGATNRLVYEQYGSQRQIDYAFKLTENIILTGDWTPFEYKFSGYLDGNGKSITYHMNLDADDLNDSRRQGLFKSIDNGGQVRNLILKNCSITTDLNSEISLPNSNLEWIGIGILAGFIGESTHIYSVTVARPTIECNIVDANIGGIAGSILDAWLEDCKVTRASWDEEGNIVANDGNIISYSGYLGDMAGAGDIGDFDGGSCDVILTKRNYQDGDMIGPVVGDTKGSGSVDTDGVTINQEQEQNCVAEGTLITLADGTQKAVEDLTGEEMLLVWNLFTGEFDAAPILFIDSDPAGTYEVVRLSFSDGTEVKVIYEHGFWDCTLNEYVYLDGDAAQYLGHWFLKQTTDEGGELVTVRVQLTQVTITQEYTAAYSPVTYGHFCYFVNGMLSMLGGIEGMFNIFEVDAETMQYDEAQMQADIAQYGLFTYEEFAQLYPVPEEMFEACGGQYLKVALGKELITGEGLEQLIARYAEFFAS